MFQFCPRILRSLGVFIVFAAALFVAVAGYAQSEPGTPKLGDVTAADRDGATVLEIQVEQLPLAPHISRLSDPDRLVFDFAGVVPSAGYKQQAVGMHSVKSVRTALFANDSRGRPVTRVVVDLLRPSAYDVKTAPGKYIITVRDQAPQTAVVAQKKSQPQVAKTAPPTNSPNPPVEAATPNELASIEFGDSTATLVFKQPVKPRVMTLDEPNRLVLDFSDVVSVAASKRYVTGPLSTSVADIRTGQFKNDPAVYRVVLDQTEQAAHPKVTTEGTRVVIAYGPPAPSSQTKTLARSIEPRPSAARALPARRMSKNIPPMVSTPNAPPTSPSTKGPKVSYANGLLSIDASNANFADILYAVAEKTGATIDMPFSDGMLDQVTFTMGPGKPRDVLATLLEGSGFNYYIVENSTGGLDKVILIPK